MALLLPASSLWLPGKAVMQLQALCGWKVGGAGQHTHQERMCALCLGQMLWASANSQERTQAGDTPTCRHTATLHQGRRRTLPGAEGLSHLVARARSSSRAARLCDSSHYSELQQPAGRACQWESGTCGYAWAPGPPERPWSGRRAHVPAQPRPVL